jgi:hypothetical protein
MKKQPLHISAEVFVFLEEIMRMKNWILAIGVIAATNSAIAQKKFEAPLVGSVILGNIEDKWGAVVYNVEMPEPDADAEQKKLQLIKQEIGKQFPHKQVKVAYRKSSSVPQPIVVKGYISDTITGIPPDNEMAYGGNDTTVAVANTYFSFQKASTGKITGNHVSLGSISSAIGLNGINDFRYDPKIIYDPTADRFICIMLNSTDSDNYIVVGFSAANSAKGKWHFYKFKGDYAGDTTWFDYPAIAITNNEFFFTGNKLVYDSSWQTGFKKSVIYQLRKQDGYNGNPVVTYILWDTIRYQEKYIRNLYPVKAGATIQGPSQYFLSDKNFALRNDTVFLIKLTDSIGGNPIINVTPLISPTRYGVPPDGRQIDTAVLATNDGRILGAYAENNEIQFTSTTVDSISGASAIYHGKIVNYTTSPVLTGNIIGIDTLDFGYPNVSYVGSQAGTNQSIITFDYTGPHTYAGFGAIFYDGSSYSDLLKLKAGTNSINISGIGHVQRWGDYSGAQTDWNDIGYIWVNGIYGKTYGVYGCYIANLKSPYLTTVPKNVNTSNANVMIYPNPAEEFIRLNFEIGENGVFDFTIYDIEGRVVDRVLRAACKEGKNLIQFNIASLSPGTYFLKVIQSDGSIVTTNRFIKQ